MTLNYLFFSLPARLGGMGIQDPVSMALLAFQTPRSGTDHIIHALRGIEEFSMADHMMVLNNSRTASRMEQDRLDNVLLESILSSLNEGHYHFDLYPVEFRDASSFFEIW